MAGQPEKNASDGAGLVGHRAGTVIPLAFAVAHVATLTDLPDARRDAKPWLSADDRDVTNGLVVADDWGLPACVRHGAMNRVDPVRRIYRCQEMYCGVGAELIGGESR